MKTITLMAVALLSLTGCIQIDSVTQPSAGTVNQAFDVQLNLSSEENTCQYSGCIIEVAVMLPDSWDIDSCTFLGNL